MPLTEIVAVLLCLVLSGCAAVPAPHHAQIPCTADAAAKILVRASAFLQSRFGAADVMAPEIVLYPDDAALRQALGFLPVERTAGYYDRAADRIHIACTGAMPFDALLMHEATHCYLHRRFSFRPPSADGEPLPSVPPWLQEGMAAWMEAAVTGADGLEVRVNQLRLAEFRQLMRQDSLPPLERVLAKGYDDPFYSADYAVSWALIWYLMQDGRFVLTDYLEAAGRGFFNDPEREYPELVAGCADFSEFAGRWDNHVSDASVAFFRRRLPGMGAGKNGQGEWRRALWLMKP